MNRNNLNNMEYFLKEMASQLYMYEQWILCNPLSTCNENIFSPSYSDTVLSLLMWCKHKWKRVNEREHKYCANSVLIIACQSTESKPDKSKQWSKLCNYQTENKRIENRFMYFLRFDGIRSAKFMFALCLSRHSISKNEIKDETFRKFLLWWVF